MRSGIPWQHSSFHQSYSDSSNLRSSGYYTILLYARFRLRWLLWRAGLKVHKHRSKLVVHIDFNMTRQHHEKQARHKNRCLKGFGAIRNDFKSPHAIFLREKVRAMSLLNIVVILTESKLNA